MLVMVVVVVVVLVAVVVRRKGRKERRSGKKAETPTRRICVSRRGVLCQQEGENAKI